MFIEEDGYEDYDDNYPDTFDGYCKSELFRNQLQNYKQPNDSYIIHFIDRVTGFCKYSDGYLKINKQEWIQSLYVPSLYLREIVVATSNNLWGAPNYKFGPALRKDTNDNIWCTKSVWVTLGNPDRKLSFVQRQEEASIMLEDFKIKLQQYNLKPTFILSAGKENTLFFVLKNSIFYPFSDWYTIKHALEKMAKKEMSEDAISELVYMPGSIVHEMFEQKQYVEIIMDNYTSYLDEFLIRDFQGLVMDYK